MKIHLNVIQDKLRNPFYTVINDGPSAELPIRIYARPYHTACFNTVKKCNNRISDVFQKVISSYVNNGNPAHDITVKIDSKTADNLMIGFQNQLSVF